MYDALWCVIWKGWSLDQKCWLFSHYSTSWSVFFYFFPVYSCIKCRAMSNVSHVVLQTQDAPIKETSKSLRVVPVVYAAYTTMNWSGVQSSFQSLDKKSYYAYNYAYLSVGTSRVLFHEEEEKALEIRYKENKTGHLCTPPERTIPFLRELERSCSDKPAGESCQLPARLPQKRGRRHEKLRRAPLSWQRSSSITPASQPRSANWLWNESTKSCKGCWIPYLLLH